VPSISELDRYRGCLLGLACGDALGTTVEFLPRGTFPPLADVVGGGPFELPPGAWTDDTSMALCLAHSLLHRRGFDAADQMNRYCDWSEHGYLSSTGRCFDIGTTVAAALARHRSTGNPFAGSTDPRTAGNGCIMRLAPVPMYYALDPRLAVHCSGESARTTHGAPEAVECTRLFGAQLRAALAGAAKDEILLGHGHSPTVESVAAIAAGGFREKEEREIRGSGYVVQSLEAALWCFATTDTYRDAVLRAANLGDDADTTAAIAGQLAGAHYGVEAIPPRWRDTLVMGEEIDTLAARLLAERHIVS
jgi:ADP-ribosyl-[dinitrogen reductase] hydrolase